MAAAGPESGIGPRTSSELRLRTLSSLVLAAVALATVWTGGWPFAALWLLAAVAVAAEWMAMTGARPLGILQVGASAGLAALAAAEIAAAGPGTMLALGLAGAALVAASGSGTRDRGWGVAGFAYAAAIVLVPLTLRDRPGFGAAAILWMFAVVWTTDVTAYFTGRAIGGPKLWPAVSPKKTWSGFAGGLVGGAAAGTAIAAIAAARGHALPASLPAVAVLSGLASVASQAGDLAESAMKRRFGVKDSGRLIPGHGGVMDRLDGFAAVSLLAGLALAGASLLGRPDPA